MSTSTTFFSTHTKGTADLRFDAIVEKFALAQNPVIEHNV